jgi:hypothetical protein
MHPTILCSIKAAPMIENILTAVKIERWRLQGHDGDCVMGSNEAEFSSYYGRAKDGGGFSVSLNSCFVSDSETAVGDEDHIVIRFNFNRNESIVSTVEFSYGLDSGCWFVVHESTEYLHSGDVDPAAGLAEQLGIELNNPGVDHVHEDHALEQIALAADYAFANCNEPDPAATT